MKEEFKYVVDNSKYVSINLEKLEEFINDLGEPNYVHWSKELDLNLSEEEWILLAFIAESMNFCFWKKPKWKIEYQGEIITGSNALFYSIIKQVEKNKDFLKIDYLYKIDEKEFANIFESIEGTIPLLEERYNNFKEVVNYIHDEKNFYNDLYSVKSDIELLNYITKHFTSFDDKSSYKAKTIHFNKRATLLTNDLFNLSSKIRNNIANVNSLSGCADYGVPRTFRDYDLLQYNNELAELVDTEKEILHDSEMEIEIRGNMLYIIEIIKENLIKKGKLINSVELDNLIWWMGKKNKKSNAHHTVTIYY